MDKRITGLLAAAAALTTAHGAAAAPGASDLARFKQPNSYAELLEPIPNAVTALRSDDESRAVSGPVERVGYYHHHHHRYHHHHHGYFRGYNYYGGYYARRHHHHHHHSYFRR